MHVIRNGSFSYSLPFTNPCPIQELRQSSSISSDTGLSPIENDVVDLGLFQQQNDEDGDGGGGGGAKAYSAQEMKQRYYEAFWRAR